MLESLLLTLGLLVAAPTTSPNLLGPPPVVYGNYDQVATITINDDINDNIVVMVTSQVEAINKNPKVKAVVLILNTPGGGVIASSIVYEELSKIKVPVVVWCEYMCASGGMYIAMAPSVKYIAIRQDTITGSIGVIMQIARYNRLLNWAKIDAETYKSGSLKDAGSGTKAGDAAERAYLQSIVNSMAARFYTIVGTSRNIKDWNAVKSARIFIGDEGIKVGLVDGIMTKDQVYEKAKELSGYSHLTYNYGPAVIGPEKNVSTESLNFALELVKEIKEGSVARFSYIMPYKF